MTKKEEIKEAFEEAGKNTTVPTLIEFIIDPEENGLSDDKTGRNTGRNDCGMLEGSA